nr:MAG TPA: hypothetical protein [Caudoviricetes sp.]
MVTTSAKVKNYVLCDNQPPSFTNCEKGSTTISKESTLQVKWKQRGSRGAWNKI